MCRLKIETSRTIREQHYPLTCMKKECSIKILQLGGRWPGTVIGVLIWPAARHPIPLGWYLLSLWGILCFRAYHDVVTLRGWGLRVTQNFYPSI